MAEILKSKYGKGWYYPYTDEDGKAKNLAIFDWIYDKYFKNGYITVANLDEMLAGKTIQYTTPNESGEVKIIPYVNSKKQDTKILKFDATDSITDDKIIAANAEKIVTSYYSPNRYGSFDYTKPQIVLNGLSLRKEWKAYSQNESFGGKSYGVVKVYRPKARTDDSITLYCEVDRAADSCIMIDEAKYLAAKKQAKEEQDARQAEFNKKLKATNEVRDQVQHWLADLQDKVFGGQSSLKNSEIVANLDPIVQSVSVGDIESAIVGYNNGRLVPSFNTIIQETSDSINRKITVNTYEDPTVVEDIKNTCLKRLKIYVEYQKLKNVRTELWEKLNTEGLDNLVSTVDIDESLDIGKFREVKKILLKYKLNPEKAIIFEMYKDIIDISTLRTNILNLLKIYYEFYNFPEKDRKSIAKFIAKHRLSDYYDQISQYDDVLETLIDESRDPKLLKPLLNSIAGTSRANVLKNKTYYFERRARLNQKVILNKPIELLDRLRLYIKEFNASSSSAILTNIELDSDESFVFQFYTFSDSGSGDDFDGRRLQYMTKIYNIHNPNKRIGFVYGEN